METDSMRESLVINDTSSPTTSPISSSTSPVPYNGHTFDHTKITIHANATTIKTDVQRKKIPSNEENNKCCISFKKVGCVFTVLSVAATVTLEFMYPTKAYFLIGVPLILCGMGCFSVNDD